MIKREKYLNYFYSDRSLSLLIIYTPGNKENLSTLKRYSVFDTISFHLCLLDKPKRGKFKISGCDLSIELMRGK